MLQPNYKQRKRPWSVQDWHVLGQVDGGFSHVCIHQIMFPWWVRIRGFITAFEYRVYWAAIELEERRKAAEKVRGYKVPANYTNVEEWQGLLGKIEPNRIWKALRKLHALRLLTLGKEKLSTIESHWQFPTDFRDYPRFLERFGKAAKRQPVPVPRRIIRILASGVGCGVAATILGVMLRCLYRKKVGGEWVCVSGGLVSASWIAECLEVGQSTVKHALRHLSDIGWIERLETPHWPQQNHGRRTVVNMAWDRPVGGASKVRNLETSNVRSSETSKFAPESRKESTPQPPKTDTVSTPPESTSDLSTRLEKHQTPERAADVSKKPSIKKITLSNLRSTEELMGLFEDAKEKRLVGGSQAELLLFVAFAERALVRGTKNPPGLFRKFVEGWLIGHLTNDDEEAARRRLKHHFHGDEEKREEKPKQRREALEEVLSADSRLLMAAIRAGKQSRLSPFLILQRGYSWTPERFEDAKIELDGALLRNGQAYRYTGT